MYIYVCVCIHRYTHTYTYMYIDVCVYLYPNFNAGVTNINAVIQLFQCPRNLSKSRALREKVKNTGLRVQPSCLLCSPEVPTLCNSHF